MEHDLKKDVPNRLRIFGVLFTFLRLSARWSLSALYSGSLKSMSTIVDIASFLSSLLKRIDVKHTEDQFDFVLIRCNA